MIEDPFQNALETRKQTAQIDLNSSSNRDQNREAIQICLRVVGCNLMSAIRVRLSSVRVALNSV